MDFGLFCCNVLLKIPTRVLTTGVSKIRDALHVVNVAKNGPGKRGNHNYQIFYQEILLCDAFSSTNFRSIGRKIGLNTSRGVGFASAAFTSDPFCESG